MGATQGNQASAEKPPQAKEDNIDKVELSFGDATENAKAEDNTDNRDNADNKGNTPDEKAIKDSADNKASPEVAKPPEPEKEQAVEGSTCTVSIGMARGCREVSWLPKPGTEKSGSEFFVVVRTEDKDDELFRTSVTKDTIWPCWRETGTIPWTKGQNLEFELMETIYNTYDIKGQIKETQTLVRARGVLKSKDFESGGFNDIVPMDSTVHLDTLLRVKVRLPGQDFLPDREMEFTASFDKAGGKRLGLDLDQTDGKTLCVKSVTAGGLVDEYNGQASPEKKIQLRDFICGVNGKSASAAEMFEELKAEKVELFIKRPMEVALGVPPYSQKVLHGIEFSNQVTHPWLLVTGIKSSLNAAQYNAQESMKDYPLLVGDRMTRAFSTKVGFGSDLIRTARYSAGLQCEAFRPYDPANPASAWYRF